jgi:hypothetical protein
MPVQIDEITSQVRVDPANGTAGALTPEMIRIITDKVVAMLLNDLRIEAERRRMFGSPYNGSQKGRK